MLGNVRRTYAELSRLTRELIFLGLALVLGLILVPLAIWAVGNRILGPYIHGTNPHAGPMALLGDFYYGLSQGWLTFWIVAVGPLAIILFVRGAIALLRYQPQASPQTPSRR
jgi:hypothetical protein